jgi:hypothetical protein
LHATPVLIEPEVIPPSVVLFPLKWNPVSQPKRSVFPSPKMSSGKLWDDLGSTGFVNTDGPDNAEPSTDNTKRTALRKRIAESSDDELDFLSSGSRSDDVIPTRNKPRAKKKQPGKAFVQGREVDHHPDYPPPKMKFPDFKKITHAASEEGSSSTPRSKTSKTKQKTSKQTKEYGILATLHDNENERLPALSDGLSSDKDLFHVSPQRGVQQFPGLALSPLRGSDQGATHLDTPRGNTKDAISYRQHKRLHNKTSSYSLKTNNRSTPTSVHASRIRSSDSSDSSEATPHAKHPKTRFRKFPTLNPLSVSDSMAPELDRGKGKAPVKGATSRVPSQTHRRIHSDTMTPHKESKSRYPFPSPLSSPAGQLSQDAATVFRETSSHGSRNITAAEDADDESQKRPQLRPFPMATSQPSTSPRRTVNCAQPTYSHNSRNNLFSSDLDVFEDDSRQRRLSMLAVRILIDFQFFWGNQRTHRASVLSVMKNFHLTLRRSIAPFSKQLDARRVLIRVQLTFMVLKL